MSALKDQLIEHAVRLLDSATCDDEWESVWIEGRCYDINYGLPGDFGDRPWATAYFTKRDPANPVYLTTNTERYWRLIW